MTYRAMKLAMTLAASAALLMGCGSESSVVAVDFTVNVSGVVRPGGSGVAIVGNYFSLGATADHPEGDPVHGLKLQLQADGTYQGSAWLPPPKEVVDPYGDPEPAIVYTVYMSNPYAPEIDAAGGLPLVHEVNFASPTGESVTVGAFDVPRNIIKPCVTFNLHVPANTPAGDPVYIAGEDDQLGPWLPGKQALADDGGGVYSVHLCFDQGKVLKYKYVRSNGDWSKVEKTADGSERPDRLLTIVEDVTHVDTVEKWADL